MNVFVIMHLIAAYITWSKLCMNSFKHSLDAFVPKIQMNPLCGAKK